VPLNSTSTINEANLDLFHQFCLAETSTGGPDPQMATITQIAKDSTPVEQVWLAGCYGAHHCIPSAVAVWNRFRPEQILSSKGHKELCDWLHYYWKALPVRPEMRSHRMIEKRAECLSDFALYSYKEIWKRGNTYQQVWETSIDSVAYYNRYMAIKFLEMLRQSVRPDIVLKDLRSKGAWSPRRTIAMIFTDHANVLCDKEDNRKETLALTERLGEELLWLLGDRGLHISHFQLQVMLCEFREATVGGYYPGASLDEELGYLTIMADNLNELSYKDEWLFSEVATKIYNARQDLFPHQYLGEIKGWMGLRKECFREFKGVASWQDFLKTV